MNNLTKVKISDERTNVGDTQSTVNDLGIDLRLLRSNSPIRLHNIPQLDDHMPPRLPTNSDAELIPDVSADAELDVAGGADFSGKNLKDGGFSHQGRVLFDLSDRLPGLISEAVFHSLGLCQCLWIHWLLIGRERGASHLSYAVLDRKAMKVSF